MTHPPSPQAISACCGAKRTNHLEFIGYDPFWGETNWDVCSECGDEWKPCSLSEGEGKFSLPQGNHSPSPSVQSQPSALTDSQIVERLAEFMDPDWKSEYGFGDPAYEKASTMIEEEDWNLWRQVEEKVMKNEKLVFTYINRICIDDSDGRWRMMNADLPTRCRALLSALDSLQAND